MISLTILSFLGLGMPEVLLIMFLLLLLFGGKKLPELAKGLGKGIREFKDASNGVAKDIEENVKDGMENKK